MTGTVSRRRLVTSALVVLALAGGALAAALGGSAGALPDGTPDRVGAVVGGDPVVVPVRESLIATLAPPMIDRLARFERQLGATRGVAAVVGPAGEMTRTIAALRGTMARDVATGGGKVTLADLMTRIGATGPANLDNQDLVMNLVLGSGEAPLPAWRWMFPSAGEARVFVRLGGGLDRAGVRRIADRLAALDGLDGVGSGAGA